MNDALGWATALFAGILLGMFFFGGLWWTTRKTDSVKLPALWFIGSFFVRTAVVMAGFWFVGAGQYQRFLLCLVGFVLARVMINLRVRAMDAKKANPIMEDYHETKS